MTSHRLRRYTIVLSAALLIPPLLWISIVFMAPTNWARKHVIAAIERRTGRAVRLERLSVQWLGGIRLTNLEIGSPQSTDDPWLRSADMTIDVRLSQLVRGQLRPRLVEIAGAQIRVLRRADGTFELADLILPRSKQVQSTGARSESSPVEFTIRGATVTLIDEPSGTRVRMENVDGDGVREDQKFVIQNLRGALNGGPFEFVGELDRTKATPHFEGRFRADDVVLDDGMAIVRYLVPVLAGAPVNLKGKFYTNVYIQGKGATWAAAMSSLEGRGIIGINPISLDGARIVAELSKIADVNRKGQLASVRSDFAIKDQRITTDHFLLNIGRVPMTLSGSTGFDGGIDYRINLKSLVDRVPDKARRVLAELNVELDTLAAVTLRGNVNQMIVQVNGVPLDRRRLRDSTFTREDRAKLRVMGRQILEQLTR